jgi:hypothetical protein
MNCPTELFCGVFQINIFFGLKSHLCMQKNIKQGEDKMSKYASKLLEVALA